MHAWSKIGCCSHIKKFNENFTVSAWIAFSQNSFYVIMVKGGTIRSIDFLEVLKALRFVRIKMNKQLINDYVIFMDNASIHKTKMIK